MKLNDNLYGFKVTDIKNVPETATQVYLMEHEKSGAALCFFDRKDECKTFAIAFKTIPTDSTGVFHILEHSVLNGSHKFPIKEPFTELLKGSLNTFLNAMTYNDRTVYPVSSRNDKDFHNLMDVYLDAVLHPLAIENENIFRQEGWRYEFDENGNARYNGVVYNEMKGASSPDDFIDYINNKLLFPDSCYSHESGGLPKDIPNLTYRQFCDSHKKFYHPSNSYIFLDGSVNLDDALPLLDSYLSQYNKQTVDIDLKMEKEPDTKPFVGEYEIEPGTDGKDKTRTVLSYKLWDHSENEKSIALSIIADALTDSNNAPLKQAIMSHGLCEDFYLYPEIHLRNCSLSVDFKGIKDGKENELISLFKQDLKNILDKGIDKNLINASLMRLEFKTREADFGSYPKGIIFMMSVYEAWLYGEHPMNAISYEQTFKNIRDKLKSDYFENLLKEAVFESPEIHITLNPSETLAQRKKDEEQKRLDSELAKLTKEEIQNLKDKADKFSLWQKTPNSKEALDTIPKLKIDDLSPKLEITPTVDYMENSTRVLSHDLQTNGIIYADLFFDISDTKTGDIPVVSFMTTLMSDLSTKISTSQQFNAKIKSHLGGLSIVPSATEKDGKAKLYLCVKVSLLDSEQENCIKILNEFLYLTLFDDKEMVKKKLKQIYLSSQEELSSAGLSFAATRVESRYSSRGYINENLEGYNMHKWLKNAVSKGDEIIPSLIKKMEEITSTAFTRERLTLGITKDSENTFAKDLILSLKSGKANPDKFYTEKAEIRNEGIAVPSMINFAVSGAKLDKKRGERVTGAYFPLANILNYSLLWQEIRVKGGAYGAGFVMRDTSDTVGYYSYRDPNPKNSLKVYSEIGEKIRQTISEGNFDLTKSIIGAVGTIDSLKTPKTEGAVSTMATLFGKDPYSKVNKIKEAMKTDTDEILKISKILDRVNENSSYCVVGRRDKLEELADIDEILDI